MVEYYNQVVQAVKDYPMVVAAVSNFVLAIVFFLSFYLPKKFVDRELRRIRKDPMNRFDKVIVLLSGIVFSIVFCVVGAEMISGCVPHQIPDEFVSVLVMFAALSVLLRSLVDSDLIDPKEVPSHLKLYRISFVSFIVASSFSILSTKFPNYVSYGFTVVIFIYYFAELCAERKIIEKCFTLLTTEEFSIGIKLVDFISRKFVFVASLGMVVIPLINQKMNVSLDTVLYVNIRDMFCVLAGMFMLQVTSSAVINRFIKRLIDSDIEKESKKLTQVHKTNWLWICDVLIITFYIAIALAILWLVGVDVQRYIFHDTIVSVVIVIFGGVLLFNAFGEFMNSLVDKAAPGDYEKLLTFMPIIKVVFTVVLLFILGLTVLSLFGIPIMPVLASLTVVWGAIAWAAGDIIKGFLQGVVFLFESNFYIGDWIVINGRSGIVIKISLRTLTVRDINGDEYIIPYSNVTEITNQSRGYFLHNECLLVAPDSDIEKASNLLVKVVNELKADPKYSKMIFGDVNLIGVRTLSDEGIKICWTLKVHTSLRLLHLEIYRRLLPLLREAGISVPYRQAYTERLLTADH
ncbi:MAG: mechanosensitive ion channel family protein [Alphaproteobacteria bacterium]|nr:mechanosensitive ion channel family protein [Alphaproteobacteria bacterium]MBO7641861.1 mechanosensitive ion channel family protein [Alphaproteobacteria bacterium]